MYVCAKFPYCITQNSRLALSDRQFRNKIDFLTNISVVSPFVVHCFIAICLNRIRYDGDVDSVISDETTHIVLPNDCQRDVS